jgi:hypothetical protein
MTEREDGTAVPKVELRRRALAFSARWQGAHSEKSEAQRFWVDFFSIFGLNERDLGTFEALAKRLSTGGVGYIDYLSPQELAVEHKSSGSDLHAAMDQLFDYLSSLSSEVKPRLLIACDFGNFAWHDIVTQEHGSFTLDELSQNLDVFWWLAGHRRPDEAVDDETELNLKATELMAKIHDAVLATGYKPHHLREWLTRILFCLFADDSEVWDRRGFQNYLHLYSSPDGTDLGPRLALLFQILNTPPDSRPIGLDDDLAAFTYINGDLFTDDPPLPMPICNSEIRNNLLAACRFNWSGISPAIFGSMFQNVMTSEERRELGAHYTTEANILRTIRPLFLDNLETEFEAARSLPALQRFHDRLASLRFLDPACGCGNFLVIAYRELRRMETQLLHRIAEKQGSTGQGAMDIALLCKVTVGQFYGIELEEFPARIARTALYLMDHQENRKVSHQFGRYFARFPIPTSPHITIGNALRLDWNDLLPVDECSFIMGNPPFVGMSWMSDEQQADNRVVFAETDASSRTGRMDYVACWYQKTMDFVGNRPIRSAFVSTNSLFQGEQARSMGPLLASRHFVIDFAHSTFAWTSEARGKAHVHCVIVGFSPSGTSTRKRLFTYASLLSEPEESTPRDISIFLTAGHAVVPEKRYEPLVAGVPTAYKGSQPTDGGYLIVSSDELGTVQADPIAAKYLRLYVQAREMLQGGARHCLWLAGAPAQDLRTSPVLRERLQLVAQWRRTISKTASVQEAAVTPALFTQDRQPNTRYLAMPEVSSSTRRFIPGRFFDSDVIAGNKLIILPGASEWMFALLHSSMWNAWMRTVSGRLKSDFSFSPGIGYYTFPFPDLDDKAKSALTDAAAKVLAARDAHPDATLADLYDPIAMPSDLVAAHGELDRAVDRLYSPRKKFTSDTDRLGSLFERYEKLTSPLLASATTNKRKRR